MGNPYAPRVQRAEAPAFPGGRFARLGANPLQIEVGEWMWAQLGSEEQRLAAEYLAGLPDDELGSELADDPLTDPGDLTMEQLLEVHDWAMAAVAAGTYLTRDEALEELDDTVAELAADEADREPAGDPQPRDEHGELIPTPDTLTGVVPAEGGPVDPANIPVGEQGLEEFVPGGPGTTEEGAVDSTAAAPSPSGTDQVLAEEAQLRIGGTIPSLLGWVGDDQAKAAAVRAAEEAKPEGDRRVTLFAELDKVAGGGAS